MLIQTTTRNHLEIDLARYPIPSGPGGKRIPFEHVVFETHLSRLNYHQVTEFVKQRAGVENEPLEEKVRNDLKAVKEARPRMSRSKRRKPINGESVAHYEPSLRNEIEPFPSTQDLRSSSHTDGGTELPRASNQNAAGFAKKPSPREHPRDRMQV
jgi:hypothetical protein